MPSYTCAVAGCSSSSRQQDVDVIGWSVFPSKKKHPTRRKLWETRCKRGAEWRATQSHAVCSKHFVDWRQELSCQRADPELFAYNDWGQQLHKQHLEPGNTVRAEAATPSEDSDGCVGDNPAPVTPTTADMQEVQNYNLVDGGTSSVAAVGGGVMSAMCQPDEDHSHCAASGGGGGGGGGAVVKPVGGALQTDKGLPVQKEVCGMQTAIREMILATDATVRTHTGLRDKALLLRVFEMIKRVKVINSWKDTNISRTEAKRFIVSDKTNIIDWFDEFLMTLVFMKEGFSMSILGKLFHVSTSAVSSIVTTWINVLHEFMKECLKWPSAKYVRNRLPSHFPAKYKDIRVILDSTKFDLVRPQNCSAEPSSSSQYEGQNTVKTIIGITPTGLITFISNSYGGNTADRHIVETEFIDRIEAGNAVMVDRGFDIGDLLLQRGARLHISPCVSKIVYGQGKASDGSDITIAVSRQIASLAVERLKTFKILRNLTPALCPYLHQMLVVISVFCNLDPPI